MSFELDRYEPIAFHTHPELMRAAEAQTAVLPSDPARLAPVMPSELPPSSLVADGGNALRSSFLRSAPGQSSDARREGSEPAPAAPAPEPIAAYLIGMAATPLLRSSLADFLDAAGARRDVRVSVGVAAGRQVSWVLRDRVPYGVRAMPRYPEAAPAPDPGAALAATAAAVVADAVDDPGRRQLVVLVWEGPPEPAALPASLRSALVLHCSDAVLTPPATNGTAGSWILARSRPGPRPSLLGHAGRLLDRWEAFADPPAGLWLGRLP